MSNQFGRKTRSITTSLRRALSTNVESSGIPVLSQLAAAKNANRRACIPEDRVTSETLSSVLPSFYFRPPRNDDEYFRDVLVNRYPSAFPVPSLFYSRMESHLRNVIGPDLLHLTYNHFDPDNPPKAPEVPMYVPGLRVHNEKFKANTQARMDPNYHHYFVAPRIATHENIPILSAVVVKTLMSQAVTSKAALMNGIAQVEAITGKHPKLIRSMGGESQMKIRVGDPIGAQSVLTSKAPLTPVSWLYHGSALYNDATQIQPTFSMENHTQMLDFVDKLVETVLPRLTSWFGMMNVAKDDKDFDPLYLVYKQRKQLLAPPPEQPVGDNSPDTWRKFRNALAKYKQWQESTSSGALASVLKPSNSASSKRRAAVALRYLKKQYELRTRSPLSGGHVITLTLPPKAVACFPEIEATLDRYLHICYLDIEFHTTAKDERQCRQLMSGMGIPFENQSVRDRKVRVRRQLQAQRGEEEDELDEESMDDEDEDKAIFEMTGGQKPDWLNFKELYYEKLAPGSTPKAA